MASSSRSLPGAPDAALITQDIVRTKTEMAEKADSSIFCSRTVHL
jgi:hypothetical protein